MSDPKDCIFCHHIPTVSAGRCEDDIRKHIRFALFIYLYIFFLNIRPLLCFNLFFKGVWKSIRCRRDKRSPVLCDYSYEFVILSWDGCVDFMNGIKFVFQWYFIRSRIYFSFLNIKWILCLIENLCDCSVIN